VMKNVFDIGSEILRAHDAARKRLVR